MKNDDLTAEERRAYSEPEQPIDDETLDKIRAEIKRLEDEERLRGWR